MCSAHCLKKEKVKKSGVKKCVQQMLFSAGWEYSYCVVHLFFNNLLSVILFQKPVWDTLWTGELPQHPTSSHFSFYSHATPSSLSWHTRIHTAKAKETRINVQTKTSLFPKISFSPDAFLDLVHINIYPPSHRNSSLKLHQQLEAETVWSLLNSAVRV